VNTKPNNLLKLDRLDGAWLCIGGGVVQKHYTPMAAEQGI